MARCSYCDSLILIGGVRDGEMRFCNAKCHARGRAMLVARQIPLELVRQRTQAIHTGPCPRCNKDNGPVDVHTAHKVYSALVMTSWSSQPQVSCRACGVKSQALGAASSLLLGWWGIPWGIVMTPVQIGKNIVGMLRNPATDGPSAQLEQMVRLDLASRASRSATG
ncbi:MAG TPA: hypothetical protein VET48_04195 [Steroidobacteraceae bacterium]|nr:hypothetical protein [Steroidobacteraceae bacterium]